MACRSPCGPEREPAHTQNVGSTSMRACQRHKRYGSDKWDFGTSRSEAHDKPTSVARPVKIMKLRAILHRTSCKWRFCEVSTCPAEFRTEWYSGLVVSLHRET